MEIKERARFCSMQTSNGTACENKWPSLFINENTQIQIYRGGREFIAITSIHFREWNPQYLTQRLK
jgi:hypothetical protein